MKREDWVWMPHAAHFICGDRCRFHLATYVGGYIVSTIGELPASETDLKNHWDINGFSEVGAARLYETMVFRAEPSGLKCCPYQQVSGEDIDFAGYNDAGEAIEGHMRMCEKWSEPITEEE